MLDKITVALVDNDDKWRKQLAARLQLRQINVSQFITPKELLQELEKQSDINVVILGDYLPRSSQIETTKKIKELYPHIEVIVLTGHVTIDLAVDSMQAGAYEFLQKPVEFDDLVVVISKAYNKIAQTIENERRRKVEELLENTASISSAQLLEELRKINRD